MDVEWVSLMCSNNNNHDVTYPFASSWNDVRDFISLRVLRASLKKSPGAQDVANAADMQAGVMHRRGSAGSRAQRQKAYLSPGFALESWVEA